MRPLFAARIELTDPPAEAWRTSRAAARLVLGRGRGDWPADAGPDTGTWDPGDGSSLRWRTDAADGVGRLWTLRLEEQLDGDRTTRRHTTVWVGEHDGAVSVQVAVALVAGSGPIVPLPAVPAGAPEVLAAVLERCHALDGPHPLTAAPLVVDARTLRAASILATDPRRSLPVLLVHRATALAQALARSLAGVAHVLDLGPDGEGALVELLELEHGDAGTVDALWPGWQLGDGAPRRATWYRRGATGDVVGAAAPIVEVVAAAAALRLDPPALIQQLRDAAVRARVEALPSVSAVAGAGSAPVSADASEAASNDSDVRAFGGSAGTHTGSDQRAPDASDATHAGAEQGSAQGVAQGVGQGGTQGAAHEDAVAAQWATDLRALDDARRQVDDLQAAVTLTQGTLDDVVALLATRFDAEVGAAVAARTASRPGAPATLGEAIALADAELAHLVFLPEVVVQAQRWPFLQPGRVLTDLRTLDAIVERWQQGGLRHGLHAAAQQAGLPWARDVSSSAHQLFGEDYTIRYGDRSVLLGPHLRYGSGPPTRQCRIYCALLPSERTLVIGHIGSHLRGARDR